MKAEGMQQVELATDSREICQAPYAVATETQPDDGDGVGLCWFCLNAMRARREALQRAEREWKAA